MLTRLFRRAHQDLGPAQGGLADGRQRARALADELERGHSVDIQHVQGVVYDWPAGLRRWRRYDEALRAPACSATGGGGLDFSPGKARWASFRVLEPHVTATKIHRATRVVARVWHLLGRSFVRL